MTFVLLVNPPTLRDVAAIGRLGDLSYLELEYQTAGADGFRSYPGEHLGLMSMLSSLRAAGVTASSVNGIVEHHRTLEQTWNAMVERAGSQPPSVVGFSGPCQVFDENLALARRVRREWPEATIVLGHDFATLNWNRILTTHDEVDLVVLGEGEAAVLEIARSRARGGSFSDIPGVAYRDESGEVAVTRPGTQPLCLDELPRVARDELPAVLKAGLSAGVFTARGCPYRCSYCTTGQVAGGLYKKASHRLRAIADVVDEIEQLVADYSIPHLTIVDDLFVTRHASSQERACEFADALMRARVRVPFMLDCRVDSVNRETFKRLADAGLHRVFVGIETGSAEQLAFYGKRYGEAADVPFVANRMRLLSELGIDVVPGMITYHPDTSLAELTDTLALVDACGYKGAYQFMNRIFAHPGTTLWQQYRQSGYLEVEWPIPTWRFGNESARRIYETVASCVGRGGGYAEIRAAFEAGIAEWSEQMDDEVQPTRSDSVADETGVKSP